MNKIYSWIASKILGRILGGQKTLILGWIVTILGIWNIVVSTENIQALCDSHNICLAGNAVLGYISTAVGEAIKILRFATGQNYDDPKFK